MIEFNNVSRHYGSTHALRNVSFRVPDGAITGLVGPNGAGKSTAMKILMGLAHASSGTALIDGKPFSESARPMAIAGALISAEWIPKDRTAMTVLASLGKTQGVGRGRCHELLSMVGLADVANARVGSFSLGMRQRLGIAVALLGRPKHLVLDEPINGLDPEGVAWVRALLKSYAREGGCVLLSSHLMSELENTADRVVMLSGGSVVADDTVSTLVTGTDAVYVEAEDLDRLVVLLSAEGCVVQYFEAGAIASGLRARQVSAVALRHGVLLDRLEPRRHTLEDVFFRFSTPAESSTAEVL